MLCVLMVAAPFADALLMHCCIIKRLEAILMVIPAGDSNYRNYHIDTTVIYLTAIDVSLLIYLSSPVNSYKFTSIQI